jgi:hypothetical protein
VATRAACQMAALHTCVQTCVTAQHQCPTVAIGFKLVGLDHRRLCRKQGVCAEHLTNTPGLPKVVGNDVQSTDTCLRLCWESPASEWAGAALVLCAALPPLHWSLMPVRT